MARFAYALKDQFNQPSVYEKTDPGKHALSIVEKNGEVILDFKQFTIVIRQK